MKLDIKRQVENLTGEAIELRRDFHMYPELGYQEYKTSKKIAEYLKKLGLLVTENITKTGVTGLLNAGVDGPTLLMRSDMDALAVDEESGVDFVSRTPGLMHACGHDASMASLLIAAKILSDNKDQIKGKILFVFQPNEENAGALNMITEGKLIEKYSPSGCMAIHYWPYLETGKLGLASGAVMAGTDHFHIRIIGKGGHTGSPHLAIDPILCSASVIQGLQSLQTREIDIQKSTLIMFGKINGGTASNIIPDYVNLEGTSRYLYKMTSAENLRGRIERLIKGICNAHGATYELEWTDSHPAVYNEEKMVQLVKNIVPQILKTENAIIEERSTAGEDFSEFTNRIPGVFIHIGSGNKEKDTCYALHNPKFNLDESAMEIGIELEVRSALKWFESKETYRGPSSPELS
ncbi:MAG: amidohydrolase [Peptostreptococcaceae bacterium]|nr:amidohydrolase [Peptostreptococcaceae bacterium]